ncbi:NADH-quinone oxidoreductase subunit M [Anaplasmataceae bacterium AB001_6]|nr:NADH-quinone oxidoreductase subunit M [Anaplasmataceae bacterium AB001_6]
MVVITMPFISIIVSLLLISVFQRKANWLSLIALLLQLFSMRYLGQSGEDLLLSADSMIKYDYVLHYLTHIDPISIIMTELTVFIILLCVIYNWQMNAGFFVLLLLTDLILLFFFSTNNLLIFYILFELSLVPMFLIIGIWGSETKIRAAFKFLFYTLFGSILFISSIIIIIVLAGNKVDFQTLSETVRTIPSCYKMFIWWSLFIAFAIKIPMFPFHTWLPEAHVQAPASGSMILAGVLIKMGLYGMLRILLPILPEISAQFADLVTTLSIIAIIYTSFVAYSQTDMKKMIAYSSVAHMGVATAGIFSMNKTGLEGAVFQMFSHGIISSALFLCIGILYTKQHTRKISAFSGLATSAPFFAFAFIILSMASVGLPGTSGFIGEFLCILGVFYASPINGLLCATGMILSACYMLKLCKAIIWGKIPENRINVSHEIPRNEKLCLIALLVLILMLGIFPNDFLTKISISSERITSLIV